MNKGLETVVVRLRWGPSPAGEPDNDLDLVAAVFESGSAPAYVVHFGSRSPDGTITLGRDSRTGQGFGTDEEMKLELDRLAPAYTRVVVGVAIQQTDGHKTFGQVPNVEVRLLEGYDELAVHDLGTILDDTAVTVAEFLREDRSGVWEFRPVLRGFDTDPESFAGLMGRL